MKISATAPRTLFTYHVTLAGKDTPGFLVEVLSTSKRKSRIHQAALSSLRMEPGFGHYSDLELKRIDRIDRLLGEVRVWPAIRLPQYKREWGIDWTRFRVEEQIETTVFVSDSRADRKAELSAASLAALYKVEKTASHDFERYAEARELRNAGLKWKEIGDRMNVSTTRAADMVSRVNHFDLWARARALRDIRGRSDEPQDGSQKLSIDGL